MHDTNDKIAADRVLKARAELIRLRRFYGVLVSNVDVAPSRQFPTMATNGKIHYYNPDYIAGLTQTQMLTVQAHESEHDARHHGTRRNGRDPVEWNICCDYNINIDLQDDGFDMSIPGIYLDEKYRGMSAEDIYRARELERLQQQREEQEKKKREEEQQNADTDPSDDEGDDAGKPSEDEDEGDDESSEGSSEGDSESSDEESSDEGEASEDDAEDGQGGGDSDEDAGDEAEGEGTGKGEGDEDGESLAKPVPQSSGDPGGMGEVLDAEAGADGETIDQQDMAWERIVRQAVSLAKKAGQLPGHATALIERENNRPQDWREVLRQWLEDGSIEIETWNRPNKRFVGAGLYLPGHQRDGINKVAMLIDTSGSMDDIALGLIQNEMQSALDEGIIDTVVAIYGDVRVTRVDEYSEHDVIDFDPRGRGGTNMRPLFDYVRDEIPDVSMIINFTDLDWYEPADEEPAVPVLFAVTGHPTNVKNHLANTPWGAAGIDVGAH